MSLFNPIKSEKGSLFSGATKNYSPSSATEQDELDILIKNEKDPFRKSLLEEKRKQRNEEFKNKVEELRAKADEMGLDPLDYYDKLNRGEITEQATPEPQGGGGILGTLQSFINTVTGASKVEQSRTDAIVQAENAQSEMAGDYQKTQLLYANTTDPVEKERLATRIQNYESQFGKIEEYKQSVSQPGWAEKLVTHPVDFSTDFLFGETKKTLGEGIDVLKGKNVETKPLEQRLAQWSMAVLEVATLGLGKKVIEKGVAKVGGEQLLKKGMESLAGDDGLRIAGEFLGEKATQEITEEFVKKSLAKKIAELAAKSTSKEAFVKEVGKEVAKSTVKVLGNKNTLEAVGIGAAFGAGGAVEAGIEDPNEIIREALKGALIGYGLERSMTGILKAGSTFHAAEKDFGVKIETAKRMDAKPTLKERLSMRKESYKEAFTPESLSAYREGKGVVVGKENSLKSVTEAMKNSGVATGKGEAIARLQDEKLSVQSEKKGGALMIPEEKKMPITEKASSVVSYVDKNGNKIYTALTHKELAVLKDEVGNIPTAKKGSSQIHLDADTKTLRSVGKEVSREEFIKGHPQAKEVFGKTFKKETLAESIERKRAESRLERTVAAKDIRTLRKAKKDLFTNEEVYQKKGITGEQIADYDKKLSTAIDNLRERTASKTPVEAMTMKELEVENRRLTKKEVLSKEDTAKLNSINKRLVQLREEAAKPEVKEVERTTLDETQRETLRKEMAEAKTTQEKKIVMRKIHENIKARIKESARENRLLDIAEPTKEELVALELEMEAGTEYSMRLGGVSISNKFDLGLFKKAQETGVKPYSFSQLSQDASAVLSEAYEKITGRKLTFKEGGLSSKEIKGEAKKQWGVARTDQNDIFTKVHEWTHFVTSKEAGFDAVKVLSKEAQTEVLTWYKITHPDMKLSLREAVAEGMAFMTDNPESAFYYLRRFGQDIQNNADRRIVTAMGDVNKLINRMEALDPIGTVTGLQSDIIHREPKAGAFRTAKEAGLWVLSKVKKTMPLYGHKLMPAELRQIEYSLFHGALNPYYAGTLKLDGVAKEAFLKFSKLPKEYKSWEELQREWYKKVKGTTEFKGLSQNKVKDKMNTDVGNYMLAKHSLERENLIGLAVDKDAEKALASEIIKKMDVESPWAKEGAEQVSTWWKQTTDSIQERFASVLTPNQRLILKQKLGYKYYVPILRREAKGVATYKMSKGGTGAIYPAMENYVAKLDKILSDSANRKAKETFIKAAEKANKRGDNLGIEDITTKLSEAKKQEFYDAATEIFGMTEQEITLAKKDGTFGKAMAGIKDLYNGEKFMPDNLMYAVVDGKERVFEIDPLIGNMFKSSQNPYWSAATASFGNRAEMVRKLVEQKFQSNKAVGKVIGNASFALMKPFTLANKVARYGIIHNPVFMVNNAARDFAESLKRSDESMSAFSTAYIKDTIQRTLKPFMGKETRSMLKEVDALYELAKSRDSLYMRAIGDGRDTSLRGAYSELYNQGFNWKKFGNAIENVTEVTESRARKTTLRIELEKEYSKGLKLGDLEENKLIEIIQKANEISVDWSAHGDLSKYLSLAPFGRATATGTASDLQFFLQKPSQYIFRTGATILPLTLGVYALNNRNSEVSKVWNSIDPQQKETYWFFVLGKKTDGSYSIFKVAKPKSIGGVVTSNVEFTLDRFKDIDPQRGYYLSSALYDSIFGSGSNLLKQGFGMDYSAYLNPLEASAIEQETNKKTYWGTDIVSPYFQTKEAVAQQNEFTSWYAKALGSLTNSSPMVIDNYMKNVGGTLGSQYLSETSEARGGSPLQGFYNMMNPEKTAVVEKATSINEPTGYSSTEVKNFYKEYDTMKKKYDSVKQYSLSDQIKLRKYESTYSDTKAVLSDYYDQIGKLRTNKSISEEEKTKKMSDINRRMTEQIRKFNESPVRKEFLRLGTSLKLSN